MKKFLCTVIAVIVLLTSAVPALSEEIHVAEFDGGYVTYEEAYEQYTTELESYAALGYDSINTETVAASVVESLVRTKVLRAKANELGLSSISDELLADLRGTVREEYEDLISQFIDFCSTSDMTDEEARAATETYLAEEGKSYDDLLEEASADLWQTALYSWLAADMTVTEDDILELYNSQIETQQLAYCDDMYWFDLAYMNDDLIVWYPENLRYIKHILISFTEEEAAEYEAIVGDGDSSDADQAALNALYAKLDDRVTAVSERLDAGEDFDTVLQECGEDPYMLAEPYSTNGYIVRKDSYLFVEEFTDAAFELENIGDISDPVRTNSGIHFLYYAGDVPSGAVSYDSIHIQLEGEAYDNKLNVLFEDYAEKWVEDVHPVYHPEYLLQ